MAKVKTQQAPGPLTTSQEFPLIFRCKENANSPALGMRDRVPGVYQILFVTDSCFVCKSIAALAAASHNIVVYGGRGADETFSDVWSLDTDGMRYDLFRLARELFDYFDLGKLEPVWYGLLPSLFDSRRTQMDQSWIHASGAFGAIHCIRFSVQFGIGPTRSCLTSFTFFSPLFVRFLDDFSLSRC